MDLILWRHAHAGDPLPDPEQDLHRPLSSKGERQAQRMAVWLNRQLTESTRVLVSPATRAQQTASALGRAFKTLDLLAPDKTVDDLLFAARYPSSREPVLVVGHQPILGLAVARLLEATDPSQPWSVRKGSVWWLRTRERDGQVQLTLHAVMGPDSL
jgi:phosphohistidine phosphatase